MEQWVTLIQTLGVAGTALMALSYFVYKMATWTAQEIVLPLVRGHLAFLDKLTQALEALVQASRDQAAASQEQTTQLRQLSDDMREVRGKVIRAESVAIMVPPAEGSGGHGAHPGGGR